MTTPATSRPGNLLYSVELQRGATLIELLVGITIGLLTIAVATGALMVSRGISGTVTDASQLQQQASYAFRVFGQQLRQAGSMRLRICASAAFTNYSEQSFTAPSGASFFRDCSGARSDPVAVPIIQSNFLLKDGELFCEFSPCFVTLQISRCATSFKLVGRLAHPQFR